MRGHRRTANTPGARTEREDLCTSGSAELTPDPGSITTVIAAVHSAADAISRTAAEVREAIRAAADDRRLYVPNTLASANGHLHLRYRPAPRSRADEILDTYGHVIHAATAATTAPDELAALVSSPTVLLSCAPRASIAAHYDPISSARERPPSIAGATAIG
jgi:hypothetical protein